MVAWYEPPARQKRRRLRDLLGWKRTPEEHDAPCEMPPLDAGGDIDVADCDPIRTWERDA